MNIFVKTNFSERIPEYIRQPLSFWMNFRIYSFCWKDRMNIRIYSTRNFDRILTNMNIFGGKYSNIFNCPNIRYSLIQDNINSIVNDYNCLHNITYKYKWCIWFLGIGGRCLNFHSYLWGAEGPWAFIRSEDPHHHEPISENLLWQHKNFQKRSTTPAGIN